MISAFRPAWLVAALVVLSFLVLSPGAGAGRAAGLGECGLPGAGPLWIDYGEGSVKPDVRAVLAKPGVVVATSGTGVPAAFRAAGARTTYFELHLPRVVGETDDPADAASIVPAADALYTRAVAATTCSTPWIALNELQGSAIAMPWGPVYAAYRANVLTLLQRLAERGAHPALLVHGNPTFAGDTALWWRTAASSGHVIYEAYYDASRMYPLGSLVASRRMRIGMRNVVDQFKTAGVPLARVGFMFGFHSALTPGIAGRQGLEPTEAWLRVVKWEAFAAKQIATEYALPTLWSWGWGTFGPESVDEDKAVAACAWLWARNPALCDAPAMAGAPFDTSRTEGQLIVPKDADCTFAGGRIGTSSVDRLARFLKDRHEALTLQFSRAVLAPLAPVAQKSVRTAEARIVAREFRGDRARYAAALAKRGADVEIARGLIADQLRRTSIPTAPSGSVFDRIASTESDVAATAICRRDDLPGTAEPLSVGNARDVAATPALRLLPFLFRHHLAPAAPAAPTATRTGQSVTLIWRNGTERDLAGYEVLRTTADGATTRVGPALVGRTTFVDTSAPPGAVYTLRAIDTSGNRSGPSTGAPT